MTQTRPLWMEPADEKLLEFFGETDAAWTASGVAINWNEDFAYGEIRTRLTTLEDQGFIKKANPDWGYFELTVTGRLYLAGELELGQSRSEAVIDETSEQSNESSSSGSPLPPEGDPDIGSLRTTHDEAREVINLQIETINNIDNKAAYTLRLNIIIVGVLLTIASLLTGNEPTPGLERFPNSAVLVGNLFSAFSFVASLWTYTSTKKETGPGPTDLTRLRKHEYNEKRWLKVLLKAYASWMKKNEDVNRRDSMALFLAHIFLFMAIGYYAFTIVWGIWFHTWSDWIMYALLVILLVALPVIVVLPRIPYVEPVTDYLWQRAEPLWKSLYNH